MKKVQARDVKQILEESEGKKIIIYGTGIYANDVVNKLKCLGLEVAYCIDHDLHDIAVQRPVQDIYSLLLEKDKFYVWIAKEDSWICAKYLRGLGLIFLEDFNIFHMAATKLKPESIFSLDATFGYSLPYGGNCANEVKIYGDRENSEYVIAILGGSTSAPCVYPWKSWGELLYEKGLEEKKKISVIVGAVNGYSSSEELFKMIRDILPLEPDMIISYSGINDSASDFPYINSYQRLLYNRIASLKQQGMYGMGIAEGITFGTMKHVNASERWMKNQKMMHLIAEGFGIAFLSFFQPSVISKKRGKQDEEIYLYIEESMIIEKEKYIEEVRKILMQQNIEYIIDATNWFDNTDGVFYDYCHVMEEGNQQIADRIYEYIIKEYGEV